VGERVGSRPFLPFFSMNQTSMLFGLMWEREPGGAERRDRDREDESDGGSKRANDFFSYHVEVEEFEPVGIVLGV